jgi:hypothetical protein
MPTLYRATALALALAGCASASELGRGDVDAGTDPSVDAATSAIDAALGADAAPPCTVVTRDLLTNSNFDATPEGTGWVEAPINPSYPIVTADAGGVAAQSPTRRAWMGGFEQVATDSLHQDVAIPASTTTLVLTGYYEVRTSEIVGVYDTGKIELTQTTGTVIETVRSLDNSMATTAWTPINHPVTANVKGTTVRLRFTTSSDASLPTSFFFDTLELRATYCE